MGYQLTPDDLAERLREQMGLLERSSESFDQGFEDEAKHLAVGIRILLHDTAGPSHSLLGLLGVKDGLSFLDTAFPIFPDNLAATIGLASLRVTTGVGAKYVALLGNRSSPPGQKPFTPWWNDPVTKDNEGRLFARRDYVLNVANKEGGAHVDPTLEETWANLTRENTLGWFSSTETDRDVPLDSPALATIRQIAYEVEQTLRGQLAHLLT